MFGKVNYSTNKKEEHKQYYKGKYGSMQQSINDDLENFIIKLSKSEETDFDGERVLSFHTPKLTREELKLVEMKYLAHLLTYKIFHDEKDPDVDPERMQKSDSKDKFVFSLCQRHTKCLTLPSGEIYNDNPENDQK